MITAHVQFSETTAAGGGIEAVLELLQSSCDETRGVACQLMASLANSSTIAEAAIEKKLGWFILSYGCYVLL